MDPIGIQGIGKWRYGEGFSNFGRLERAVAAL